jgi:hypothetical protein
MPSRRRSTATVNPRLRSPDRGKSSVTPRLLSPTARHRYDVYCSGESRMSSPRAVAVLEPNGPKFRDALGSFVTAVYEITFAQRES